MDPLTFSKLVEKYRSVYGIHTEAVILQVYLMRKNFPSVTCLKYVKASK